MNNGGRHRFDLDETWPNAGRIYKVSASSCCLVESAFARTNGNWLASLSKLVLCITLWSSCSVGLTIVDRNVLWPAVAGQSLAYRAFGSAEIAIFAEVVINRIAVAIDCTIKVPPLVFDIDIRFSEVSFACDLMTTPIETFLQFGAETDGPTGLPPSGDPCLLLVHDWSACHCWC